MNGKWVYSILLAVVVMMFVGFGVDVLYRTPQPPSYPSDITSFENLSSQDQQKLDIYNSELAAYNNTSSTYNKNASTVYALFLLLFAGVGLSLYRTNMEVANGLLVGAIASVFFGINRGYLGYSGDSNVWRFGVITVMLIIILYFGIFRKGPVAEK